MIQVFLSRAGNNADLLIEFFGFLTALVYLYFSIKQKIWLWPFGILTSSLYIYIFYISSLYADMGLQIYYVLISFYGWYHWVYGASHNKAGNLPISTLSGSLALKLLMILFIIYWIIVFILLKGPAYIGMPPSDLPYWDAFTTSVSIIATWMLARKIIEHWIVWIIVDSVSFGLYIYKELYITVVLFLIYTILAFVGFYEWKKNCPDRS